MPLFFCSSAVKSFTTFGAGRPIAWSNFFCSKAIRASSVGRPASSWPGLTAPRISATRRPNSALASMSRMMPSVSGSALIASLRIFSSSASTAGRSTLMNASRFSSSLLFPGALPAPVARPSASVLSARTRSSSASGGSPRRSASASRPSLVEISVRSAVGLLILEITVRTASISTSAAARVVFASS